MKIILQRVTEASCTVEQQIVSSINKGYVLLVGFTHTDTLKEVEYCAKKVANLRVFEDDAGKLNRSIQEVNGQILSISQFTIYGNTSKGNRPSFTEAMNPTDANHLYQKFNDILQNEYHIVTKSGVFGAHMDIRLTNDGPVTILIESK